MTQQKISTPSVIDVIDSVVKASVSYAYPEVGGIAVKDPWGTVLSKLEPYALDPETLIPALRNALSDPRAENPLITRTHYEKRFASRIFVLVGPEGSGAEIEGEDDAAISSAISSLGPTGGWVVLLPGTYSITSTVTIPANSRLIGSHPETTILQVMNDTVGVSLSANATLSFVTIAASQCLSVASVSLGEDAVLDRCKILDFECLGAQLVGDRSKTWFCRFESSATNQNATGLALQGRQQTVEACSFHGPMSGGAVQIEGHENSILNSLFDQDLTGPSFSINSLLYLDNKIVGCHFASPSSLSLSTDSGTKTVKHGNTPNDLTANTNTLLNDVQVHTGQPAINSSEMVLSNSFTHEPSVDNNATSLLGKIDEAVEQIFEERNITIELADPVFDEYGNAIANYFEWDGTENVFSWPDFIIRSVFRDEAVTTVSAGQTTVPAGHKCYLNIVDGSLATADTVSLASPDDRGKLTLLTALADPLGAAVWLDGIRLEADLNIFDRDGNLLSLTRYLGVSDTKNPSRSTGEFSSPDHADITTQLGDQSLALKSLYESVNIQYNRETEDSRISTEPAIGEWYSPTVWAEGVPATPTHLINVQGTLYGLVASSGIYFFDRSSDGWRPVAGCPLSGPFSAISRWASGLCLLACDKRVVTYTPEIGWGAVLSPTKSAPLEALTLTTSAPTSSWYDAGQADFALQTENYSLFTTVDGHSIRWYQDENFIELMPRIYTESAGSNLGLMGFHPKDTGYNVVLGSEDLCMTGNNGGFSRLSGLPLSNYLNGEILVNTDMIGRSSALRVDWSSLVLENLAVTQPNNDFIVVAANSSRNTFYVIAGGKGTARLVAVLDSSNMPSFTASSWVLDAGNQKTYVFGTSSTNELVCYLGAWQNGATGDKRWGAGKYVFTRATVLSAGKCSSVVATIDRYNDGSGSGNIVALVCDPSRSNRPTWVEYDGQTASWSSTFLTDQISSDPNTVQVSVATTNSFDAQAPAAFGLASPFGVSFLVKAGNSRPYLFRKSRASGSFDSYDAGGTMNQCFGAVYHPAFKSLVWMTRGATADQVRLYTLFEAAATTPTVWTIISLGVGGTYLPGISLGTPSIRRSGSMIGRAATIILSGAARSELYFYSAARGVIKGTLTGGASGFTSQSWSIVNPRAPSDPFMFSNTPTNTYSCLVGGDRGGDLSLQLFSLAESLPTLGFSVVSQPDDYEGLVWFEPGTVVKNVGLPYLWAGINRGGYLWIGDARATKSQYEFGPNTQVRCDQVVPNLAASSDFDCAITSDKSKVGFCIRTSANYLFFLLYDVATRSLSLERQGIDFPNLCLLSSSPKISYNSSLNCFEIVGQDNSRAGGQFVFYRRYLSNGSWLAEQVGSGSSNLASLGSQSCKMPSKTLPMSDGTTLVACEGLNYSGLILRKSNTGWSLVWQSSEGGFASPALARTLSASSTVYFIFGGVSPGVRSAVASSSTGVSSWSYLVNPTASEVSLYTRVKSPEVYMADGAVYVASSLAAETGTTDAQEFGVFKFTSSRDIYGSAFAAKSRISANLSGQEETNYSSYSWTYKGDLLYAATRPNRSQPHWSIRRSLNDWQEIGESVVGSGRIVALDNTQYRESFVSASQTSDKVIVNNLLERTNFLPLATRREKELWGLSWSSNSSYLFSYGDTTQATPDTTAPTGSLPSFGTRPWPRIVGTTQGIISGASIFGHGAGLRLQAPVVSNNYFGTTLPSNGLFRLRSECALTFHGTHRFRVSQRNDKEYVIDGPLVVPLTEAGQDLILDFATPNSLTIDDPSAPMSYWSQGDIPKYRYPLTLGRNDDQRFVFSSVLSSVSLTHGNLEPRELQSGLDVNLDSRKVAGYSGHTKFAYEVFPCTNGGLKVKILGSNHGLQSTSLSDLSQTQLLLRGPLSVGLMFFQFVDDAVRAGTSSFQPVVTASGTLLVIGN